MVRVLHISNNAAYTDNPITTAFRDEGFLVQEVDFFDLIYNQKYKRRRFVEHLMDVATNFQPNFIFMQIQHAGIIDYEDAYYLNKIAPLISYSGDVRNDASWHELMGAAGALTLINNDEDIEHLRSLGFKADYLQVSFHKEIHNVNRFPNVDKKGKVVFIGTNYDNSDYPLTKERKDLCLALFDAFGNDFGLYGHNWNLVGLNANYTNPNMSSYIYNQYDIAVNHSHYQRSRYTSDRLFYILASGTFCLTQWYPRIEEEFEDDKHLVIYKDIPELIDKCKYWLLPENELKRKQIAQQGCEYVFNNCTWNHRVKQLIPLINKYFPNAMTKNDNWIETLKKIRPEMKYSQFGEEAFITHIFNNIQTTNKFFVDLGAGNGEYLSNTKLLKDEYGWKGIMVDANTGGNKDVVESFITDTNIIDILQDNNVPEEFDLLSIDLDGNDWYILSRILEDYSPRLIIAEFNGTIPVGVDKVIEYNENHTWNNDDYYGASFEAFKRLGKIHGYSVIFSYASTNIYLLRKDELCEPDKDWGVTYIPQQYHAHNPSGRWTTTYNI